MQACAANTRRRAGVLLALLLPLVGLSPSCGAGGSGGGGGPAAVAPPNVLLVVLDDVGIDQLGVYDDQNGYADPLGYPYARTPTIDSLAAGGVRFDQCRAMPVCSPTRASLLSGRYPFRHGAGRAVRADTTSGNFGEFGVAPAPAVTILPEVVAGAGVAATAVFGKWHLALEPADGGTLDTHPTDLGFDAWRGSPRNLDEDGPPMAAGFPPGYWNFWWVEGGVRGQQVGTFHSEHVVDRAIHWLTTAPEPFLAEVALSACHTPLTGANWPGSGHGFGAAPPSNHLNTRYRACLENLDTQLGRLLAALDPAVRARTLVVVVGDNGSSSPALNPNVAERRYPVGHPSYLAGDETRRVLVAPYDPQRVKHTVYEGGIRVPLIVQGAGVSAPGRTSGALVDAVDVFSTVVEITGATPPAGPLDGIDFSEVLADPAAPGARSFSFSERFSPNGVSAPAARDFQQRAYLRRDGADVWKLVHSLDASVPLDQFEFFHLAGPSAAADPLEVNDLGMAHPEFQATRNAYAALVGGL